MKKHALVSIALLCIGANIALDQQEDPKQLVDLVKKNLATSMQQLKNYEWLETTEVYYKGEKKSSSQSQCYYSVDGKLTKVPTGANEQDKQARGLRGRIVENKKEEMTDYAEACVKKIQQYLPPDGSKLQAAFAAGKTNIQVLSPGKQYAIAFADYLEAGDQVKISIDKTKALLTMIGVATSVTNPSDKITFSIKYAQLPDGTEYPAETILDMPAKQLKISIMQGGFKKAAR
jgi:hypothetical protein